MKKYMLYMLLIPLLGSCTMVHERFSLLEANYLALRGNHAGAIEVYMDNLLREDFAEYSEYGLATLYLNLGEYSASLTRLDRTEEMLSNTSDAGVHKELQFRVAYNRGIALFQNAEFDAAARAFRRALEIDPARNEAKRNLELSIISQSRSSAAASGSSAMDLSDRRTAAETVFSFIREKEEERWRSREWASESDAVMDY